MEGVITSWVTVEANNFEEAIDEAYLQGTPGVMHLDHTYPDVSELEVPDWWIEDQEAKQNEA